MNPETAIATLDDMLDAIQKHYVHLVAESRQIEQQWEQLRQIGGQRADHAATLLSRLRSALRDLARFCTNAEAQITEMVADPFGRKAS